MTEPYLEDDGSEFPINNCVQCGQTEYVASFGEDKHKVGKMKSMVSQGPKAKFLPKVAASAKK